MKRNIRFLPAALAVLGLLGAAGAMSALPASTIYKISVPRTAALVVSPAKKRKLHDLSAARTFGKPWPFNGKNRAQRARLMGAFCYLT